MVIRNQLVVKLPRARVDELVEAGTAERFDRGKGQPMKEWAATPTQHEGDWKQLMMEALEFVRAGNRRGSTKTNRTAPSRRT
jgi:hypothetical protein